MADGNLGPEAFNELLASQRPRLHRYCARMVGSAFDGEDVVQEALAKAMEAFPGAGSIARPERWLFRIAHNTALDALRRRKRQASILSDRAPECVADATAAGDARVSAEASLAALMGLPVAQRAALVLIDVLGHSAAEAVDILGVSLAALKAALHRGRERLQAPAIKEPPVAAFDPAEIGRLRAYADRFNARDFDALRALLADEVRLDLVNRTKLAGRKDVAVYFTRYEGSQDWRFAVGVAEGRPALLVSDPADPTRAITYVVLLNWADGQIATIRDFKYADYVMQSLDVGATPF
jgi:RNA polymerase sigma-70 factor (ECF subfamily)